MKIKEAREIILNIVKKQLPGPLPAMPIKSENFIKYKDNPVIMKMVRKMFADNIRLYRSFREQANVMAQDMCDEVSRRAALLGL